MLGLSECEGKAIIHHSPRDEFNPWGHYSIEIFHGPDIVHTHQTWLNYNARTTHIDSILGEREDVSTSIVVNLPNAKNAIKYQDKIFRVPLGIYDYKTNSCLTHVSNVLREGGVDIPDNASGQIKYIISLGFKKKKI